MADGLSTELGRAAARIMVFMAKSAPMGVVLRRGPSRWMRLALWNTATDKLTPGQWFHGRIYDERCDISPDGSLMIYFAAKYQRSDADWQRTPPCWTAIGRPPYFSALQLWPQADNLFGGGFFAEDRRIYVCWNPQYPPEPATLEGRPYRFNDASKAPRIVPELAPNPEYSRLCRDGWTIREHQWRETDGQRQIVQTKFERPSPDGRFTLVMWRHLEDFNVPRRYILIEKNTGAEIPLDAATWADWDHKGRFALASYGKLLVGDITAQGVKITRTISDFNVMKPSSVYAPPWAARW